MNDFTGEYFLPGQTNKRLFSDHFGRYSFAREFICGKRVLDIACGSGYGSYLMASSGAKSVDGVDISTSAITYAREHFKFENLFYTQKNILDYETENKYDVIISFETIEHVDDYRSVIKKYRELLTPGGILLLSSPNRLITSPHAKNLDDQPGNKYHIREFTINEMIDELSSLGFTIDKKNVYGQRLQPYFSNMLILKWYKKIFQPHKYSNKYPKKVNILQPRYFIILANNT